MPLTWKRGCNPYRLCAFGILRLGPFATPNMIVDQARELGKEIRSGRTPVVGDVEVDEHMLGDASKRLRQPRGRAEELLLTHQQVRIDHRRRKKLIKELRASAVPPEPIGYLPLRHPLALFWFTPVPRPAAAPRPGWDELGITAPDDPQDLKADIVYAG